MDEMKRLLVSQDVQDVRALYLLEGLEKNISVSSRNHLGYYSSKQPEHRTLKHGLKIAKIKRREAECLRGEP